VETLSGTEEVGFAWVVLLGFIRLTTNAAVLEHPLEVDEACDYVDGRLGQPRAVTVAPGRPRRAAEELLEPLGTAANLTSDAHLAALAIERGAELHSADADFLRFPGPLWRDPLR
jgi:uncharacterized protein